MPIPGMLSGYERRVLIAEDEPAMATAIQRVLHGDGFQAMIARDGFQAGGVIESYRPAAIGLGLRMPYMKGLEVPKCIRADECYSHIRVVVVSAAPREQLEEARAAGADRVLEKPFDNDQLLAEVNSLLPSLNV